MRMKRAVRLAAAERLKVEPMLRGIAAVLEIVGARPPEGRLLPFWTA
jgi:hypothetical protein